MPFNPYGFPMQQSNPQQIQNEYNSLMSQYQSIFNQNQANNPQQIKNPAVSERGQFVKVNSFDETEEYPTPLDGTATLFFDFKNRVFWSKKFINGGHSIQAFKFEPINSPEPAKAEEEIDYTKMVSDMPDPAEERFSKIESTLSELVALLKAKPEPKKGKEVVKDEV